MNALPCVTANFEREEYILTDKERFLHPDATSNAAENPFWFLNDKLEDDELQRQLALMDGIGVTDQTLHARSGILTEYLSQDWFDRIETILAHKRANGGSIWLYDEYNWPSGNCNRTVTRDERYREQYLEIRSFQLAPGESYQVSLLRGLFLHIGVCFPGTDRPDETLYKSPGNSYGNVQYTADAPCVLYESRVCQDLHRCIGGLNLNYIDAKATQAFIDSTHSLYEKHFGKDFGKTITGFFTDEPRFCNSFVWSDDFAETFKEEKGYDLIEMLPYLVQKNQLGGRTRCDYYHVAARMYSENFFRPLHQWLHERGMGLAAHLLGEETLAAQTKYAGDYMRQTRYLDFPGIDHLGKGIGSLNPKFGSSAAHNYGKDLLNSETFAGCGWDFTFEEMVRMTIWLFSQGVNVIINHGFFYSTRDERQNDWPPSQFFQWKDWPRMAEYNQMLRRLHHCFSGGRLEADILVYHPIETFWHHYLPDQGFTLGCGDLKPIVQGERAAQIDRETQLLLTTLSDQNLDYTVLNSDACENFAIENGRWINRLTGGRYSAFILPMTEVLPIQIARQAVEMAHQGGLVIALDCLPSRALDRRDDAELQSLMDSAASLIHLYSLEQLPQMYEKIRTECHLPVSIVEGVSQTVHTLPAYGREIEDPYVHYGEDLSGVGFMRYLKGGKRHVLFANYNPQSETLSIAIQCPGEPEIWDPMTGSITAPAQLTRSGNSVTIRLTIPSGQPLIVTTDI